MEERIYRNIWKEIGISDAQVEERLSQLISTFFYDEKERLYFPVGDDMAYIEDTGNNDAGHVLWNDALCAARYERGI